jgi:hypothetical protein
MLQSGVGTDISGMPTASILRDDMTLREVGTYSPGNVGDSPPGCVASCPGDDDDVALIFFLRVMDF